MITINKKYRYPAVVVVLLSKEGLIIFVRLITKLFSLMKNMYFVLDQRYERKDEMIGNKRNYNNKSY